MFTKNDIGVKVVSDLFGIGVITRFDEGCKYPVGVMFNCFKYIFESVRLKTVPDCYFEVDGSTCIADRPDSYIRPLIHNTRIVPTDVEKRERSSLDVLI